MERGHRLLWLRPRRRDTHVRPRAFRAKLAPRLNDRDQAVTGRQACARRHAAQGQDLAGDCCRALAAVPRNRGLQLSSAPLSVQLLRRLVRVYRPVALPLRRQAGGHQAVRRSSRRARAANSRVWCDGPPPGLHHRRWWRGRHGRGAAGVLQFGRHAARGRAHADARVAGGRGLSRSGGANQLTRRAAGLGEAADRLLNVQGSRDGR
mmetsp:Transcript_34416/g.94864  ORF Transcript_34416/g.94864 Transcript_34416/m.94864 type:complete len:207 (-) Transcript_34416:664-1284(-)